MRVTQQHGLVIVNFDDTPRNQNVRLELRQEDADELAMALAKVKGVACDHNQMVSNSDPEHAWKCAKCGYVYGS